MKKKKQKIRKKGTKQSIKKKTTASEIQLSMRSDFNIKKPNSFKLYQKKKKKNYL